jgi:hypothetical protein
VSGATSATSATTATNPQSVTASSGS